MKLYLLAGEPSGDKLGGALISGLRQFQSEFELRGVGGDLMTQAGLESQFPMQELSVMGIAEVLPKYPALKRRLNEAVEAVLDWKPDALITIDSPDFSLRLAKAVKKKAPEIRTIHYVAPSVWAWRSGRAAKMAHFVDQVLALLPFEPPYMEAAGMECQFVGHPIVAEPKAQEAEIRAFREGAGLGDAPILLVLPGSRNSEISRLAPIFGEAIAPVLSAHPDMRVIVPVAPGRRKALQSAIGNWPVQPYLLDPSTMEPDIAPMAKRAAFASADLALAASGTVSLELAAAGTPMVIAYDMAWLSWQIMSRLARVDSVTLVNLVAENRTVPEFLGPNCRPDKISTALLSLMQDQGARALQIESMALAMRRLGEGEEDPGRRAARAVLEGLGGDRIEVSS